MRIISQKLEGSIDAIPSKSFAHRYLIASALSDQETFLDNMVFSDDTKSTILALQNLGAIIDINKNSVLIKKSINLDIKEELVFNCMESGSTIRFMIPICGLLSNRKVFEGIGKLKYRPLNVFKEIFENQNLLVEYNNELPFIYEGKIKPDNFKLRADISSQFITGLLFILPLLNKDSKIEFLTKLESREYVKMTIDVLKDFGIEIDANLKKEIIIRGNQKFKTSKNYKIEGDYSQAAFWIVAALLNGKIKINNLKQNSSQADKEILNIIKRMGAKIKIEKDSVFIKKQRLNGIKIDASQCPDIVPILAVLASVSKGKTTIYNAKRLRIKESDRILAIVTELKKLGADIMETKDGMIIEGKKFLEGSHVDSWNDHRIAMALSIAGLCCKKPILINGFECVKKSYPTFFEDFKKLGAILF